MMYWRTFSSRSARGPCSPPNISRSPKDRWSGTLYTSFFCTCGVSCRVRAEREKPYAGWLRRPSDSPRGRWVRVGPPPPGATRELGVVAMLLSLMDIRPKGCTVNTHESSLFTGVRGRGILGSPYTGSRIEWAPGTQRVQITSGARDQQDTTCGLGE